jgi:hypothetical protein
MNVTTVILGASGVSGVLHARRRILDEVLPLLADKPERRLPNAAFSAMPTKHTRGLLQWKRKAN